jgi:hypothetical protein
MTDTEALVTRTVTEMVPLPIVVDADVLHRNVDYSLRRAAGRSTQQQLVASTEGCGSAEGL